MTPMFKTGSRKWDIHYSILVNGERHERNVPIESQSAEHAEKTLRSRFKGQDVELEIHKTTRIS